MKIKILKNFTLVIQKNKLIDWIKDDTELNFNAGEELKDPKDVRFIALKEIWEGNLIMQYEYQLFTGASVKVKNDENKEQDVGMIAEITDEDALWNLNFIEVEE